MKKTLRILKVIIAILLVVLLSLIAFAGIFKSEKGLWNNIIPDYKYGMDVEGTRELRYVVDESEDEKYVYIDDNNNIVGEVWENGSAITEEKEKASETEEVSEETVEENAEETSNEEKSEETDEIPYKKETRTIKVNNSEDLTKENFEKAKSIIQKRLRRQGVESYNIRLDDVTGKLVIETNNDDDNINTIESIVREVGKFKIVDYENGIILMDNSDVKNATAVYSANSEYEVFLQINLNKTGAEKLKEISKKYVKIENEPKEGENADATSSSQEEIKYITIMMDDTKISTTYFGDELNGGILQVRVGESTSEYEDFISHYNEAQLIADSINTGILPISYTLQTDNFVKSSISNSTKQMAIIIFVVINAIIGLIFIVKYKKSGLLAFIISIGFISTLAIVSKYTNVLITINSLIALSIIVVMNYIFTNMVLKNNKENGFFESMKKFYLNIIPIIVAVLVFIFTKSAMINSIGMIGFWGIILIALYNVIFLKTSLDK